MRALFIVTSLLLGLFGSSADAAVLTHRPAAGRQRPASRGVSTLRSHARRGPRFFQSAGGALRSGKYRVSQNTSHTHLSGTLQKSSSDVTLTVRGRTVTFGDNTGALQGLTVTLVPDVQYRQREGVYETVGWVGRGEVTKSNATHTFTVRVTGHVYQGFHPGLRLVTVEQKITSGFRTIATPSWSLPAWRE